MKQTPKSAKIKENSFCIQFRGPVGCIKRGGAPADKLLVEAGIQSARKKRALYADNSWPKQGMESRRKICSLC